MKREDFDGLLTANLSSAFLCTRAALRTMLRARWGRIVNVTSISGIMRQVAQANYPASKAGLIAFTKSAAPDLPRPTPTLTPLAPPYPPPHLTPTSSHASN